jgi:NAD(P)-dependent dehydrogenase (short-subunit alcohol dehydrogenase family)
MVQSNCVARVVVLTGAAGGIGSAIAKALIDAGHLLAAVDLNGTALDRLSDLCNSDHLFPVLADLTAEAACNDAVARSLSRFGRIEAVINNAGIGMSSIRPDAESRHPAIEEISCSVWDNFFNINVRAAMLVTKAALPHIRDRGWGRIINKRQAIEPCCGCYHTERPSRLWNQCPQYGRQNSEIPASRSTF